MEILLVQCLSFLSNNFFDLIKMINSIHKQSYRLAAALLSIAYEVKLA